MRNRIRRLSRMLEGYRPFNERLSIIERKNDMNDKVEVTVDYQGAYNLYYSKPRYLEDSPIQYEYDGGGSEYLEVEYKGETYYYTDEEGWSWMDNRGESHYVDTDSDLNDELFALLGGENFWALVERDQWRRVEKLLPDFLEENNLEIFYEPDDQWANFGVYYVVEKGKKIDTEVHDMSDWENVTKDADEIEEIARIILNINRIECGVKYHQELQCPEYL